MIMGIWNNTYGYSVILYIHNFIILLFVTIRHLLQNQLLIVLCIVFCYFELASAS